MTQGEGKGIGLVLRRCFREGEQETYHMLDLGLLRAPGADHSELDRFGAVLVDLHIPLEPGAEHRPPGLTELQGGGHIAGKDKLFYRHLMGPILLHHLGDTIEEHTQPLRPRQVIDPNTTAGNPDAAPAVRVDYPESGGAGAWIDA